MKIVPYPLIVSLVFFVAAGAAGGLRADVIETPEGAHLVGHVTRIAGIRPPRT
jgi:hypothetical protein